MKVRKWFFILIVLGLFFTYNNVFAFEEAGDHFVWVGTEKIHEGETKNIYGGTVSLISDVLILNNVTIDKVNIDEDNKEHTIFDDEELNVKLVGNNTFNATCTSDNCTQTYYQGIYSEETVNIYGDGKLNFNISNYGKVYPIRSLYQLNLGSGINDKGPTIKIDIDSNDLAVYGKGLSSIKYMYNSNVFMNVDIVNDFEAYQFYSNSEVYNSNLSIKGSSSNYLSPFSLSGASLFNNCNMLGVVDYKNSGKETMNSGFHSGGPYINVILDDCRVAIVAPAISDSPLTLDLRRTTDGKIDYYFAGKVYGNITFNNISDDMKYTSTTTKEALSTTPTYNPSLLSTYKYIHITNIPNYKLVQGWFPIYPYSPYSPWKLKTDGNAFFMSALKVDGVEFDSNDFKYTDDGTIDFNQTGINKMNDLTDGTHTLEIEFYNNKKIVYEFDKTDIEEVNPPTVDNIIFYIIGMIISMIGMVSMVIINKHNIKGARI